MPQFIVSSDNINGNEIRITDISDIKHIKNVLRFGKNDRLAVSDPDGYVYEVKISEIKPECITTIVIDKYKSHRKLNIDITLAQSILKASKQDMVIQKATELGVKTIIPLITKNTVVKIDSNKDQAQKIQRWTKIAYESCKQCQRYGIPEINQITKLNELINLKDINVIFSCVEREAELSIKDFLVKNNPKINQKILIIIGPEGGWDDGELDLFRKNNIALVSLGNLILRAETAVIAAISDVIYEYEL